MEKRSQYFFLYGVCSALIIPLLRWVLNYDSSWGMLANRILLVSGIISMVFALLLVIKARKKK